MLEISESILGYLFFFFSFYFIFFFFYFMNYDRFFLCLGRVYRCSREKQQEISHMECERDRQ